MRLAQMYLGSSHYAAGSIMDEASINKADSCLKGVDQATLSLRSGCHFHLIESDLYHSKGMLSEARRAAHCALEVSERHNFTNEISSAKNRLGAF